MEIDNLSILEKDRIDLIKLRLSYIIKEYLNDTSRIVVDSGKVEFFDLSNKIINIDKKIQSIIIKLPLNHSDSFTFHANEKINFEENNLKLWY